MTDPALNPDPLRPPETDSIDWAAQLDRAFDEGYAAAERARPPFLQLTAFGVGLVVGMFAATVLAFAQAVRCSSCPHLDFAAEVDVNRLEDIGALTADVRIRCSRCGQAMVFVGIPAGLSSDGPRVDVSGTEVHLPLVPFGESVGDSRYGYTIRMTAGRPDA